MTRREFIGAGMGAAASAAIGRPIRSTLGSMERFENGTRLPYDAEVEYIESTGTQWIDTGFAGDSRTSTLMLHFSPMIIAENRGLIGSRISTNTRFCWGLSPTYQLQVGYYNQYVNISFNGKSYKPGEDFVFYTDIANNSIVYNISFLGNLFSHAFPLASFPTQPVTLFTNQVLGYAIARVKKLKFFEAGVLARDYQPVRFTNEFGMIEGALYDSVTGELFRNQGTSSFIIGPDI